ncbi:MAG: hypothetical protein Q8O99_01550 [bacterium]|nr:hypothetical protein [bacterium]
MQQISPLFTGTLLISPYSTKEKLIELLSEAKYKIRIRMYQLDDTEVLQLLKNKAYLGLSVELIVENKVYGDDQGGSYADLLKEIKGSSIEIITDEQL